MELFDHEETAQEIAQILRGTHPGWRGDPIRCAYHFLRGLRRNFNGVPVFADDLEQNTDYYAQQLALPAARVRWIAQQARQT